VVLSGTFEPIEPEHPLRVLLIEDSPDDAELTLQELRNGGYVPEYVRVESGAALRQALADGGWQIVLCDYSMPGFDAMAALSIVKEHRLDVPFIIISGAVDEETAVAAMRAGAHDFLIKGRLARFLPAVARELREAAVRAERTAMQQQLLLSDRLVQIGTLAAGVAHEINNPLSYVIGNIVFALDELTAPHAANSTALISALHQAREGAERIRAIAADLRVFSRSEAGAPAVADLRRVLESSINMAWNQIRHRARLTRDFGDVPPVAASENRLGQVFLNLLINAADAIPAGDSALHEIVVRLRADEGAALVEVSDSGLGIAPQLRDQIFEPFFTTKPSGTGTGLGLSISRQIVDGCGGQISAHENPGGGTTFRVRLPAAAPPIRTYPPSEASAAPPPASPALASERLRVLVIDDEPAIVDIVKRLLRNDFEMVGTVGAEAALELLRRDSAFGVVFCDLMMPGVSGSELYAKLEQIAPHLRSRVIFLTGGAFTPEASHFLAHVDNLRVHKPFDPNTLRAAVQELLVRVG
jgi:signal transduction histidine kinase